MEIQEYKDDYPNEFIRGIPNASENYITKEGYPTKQAFVFEEYDSSLRNGDGWCEMSVNWLDDAGAIDVLMQQVNIRKGGYQFNGGCCVLDRVVFDAAFRTYVNAGNLSYERKPVEATDENAENKYHGNILLKNTSSKMIKTNIECTLATLAAGNFISRASYEAKETEK